MTEPYRISCAVCGKACEWIDDSEATLDRGWYCEPCDTFTEDRLED